MSQRVHRRLIAVLCSFVALSLGWGTNSLRAQEPSLKKYWVYLGCNTGGASGGQGISVCEFNATTGELSEPKLAAKVGNPSFLTIHPNGKTLYSVGESSGPEGGPIYAFRIGRQGELTLLNELRSGGAGPCHVATDAAGKFLVASNYSGGSVAIFSLAEDGRLQARTDFIKHAGSSVNPARQKAPHAHCGFFDDRGQFVLVADLGCDQVFVYELNRTTGRLTPKSGISMPPGSGPRHFHIAPGSQVVYINGELDSTIHRATLNFERPEYKITQTLSTLPQPTPGNTTAECRIHPNGRFVYVSNRGHDSIAVFEIMQDKLEARGHVRGMFKVPRNFNLDPSGQWMLVGGQTSNTLEVFRIGDDGIPKATGRRIQTPSPICIKFLLQS